jgi:hypothetical protein
MDASVAVEIDTEGGSKFYTIKISTDTFEVNVRVPAHDAAKLEKVRATPWINGALRIGESAGSPAFWSIGGHGQASILFGQDDQSWDIAVLFPPATIDAILQEIAAASREQGRA